MLLIISGMSFGSLRRRGCACTKGNCYADEEGSGGFGKRLRLDSRFQNPEWGGGSPANRACSDSLPGSDESRRSRIVPVSPARRMDQGTRPRSRRFGTQDPPGAPKFRTFGSTISVQPTQLGSAPGALRTSGVTQMLRQGDGLQSLQEVLADEVADEARGFGRRSTGTPTRSGKGFGSVVVQ